LKHRGHTTDAYGRPTPSQRSSPLQRSQALKHGILSRYTALSQEIHADCSIP
jgi:hypothetical protein